MLKVLISGSLFSLLPLLTLGTLFSQTRTIRGTVTDHSGASLPGASIWVKNSGVGTVVDKSGSYIIEVPESAPVLIFQYLGFEKIEESINGRLEINVQLLQSTSPLEEVVVVGFGAQRRRLLTSSISSVGKEAFENISVPVLQRALQGRLPGVVMTNASGGLNAESIIRIRGVGSISAGNQPLFVVDGLILAARPDGSLGYSTNPLIGLNPNDIVSVEVLKDAAAASIYGSRGSNGVILITTKSGTFNQHPEVNIDYYAGFSKISQRHDLLNGKEYATLWNEAALNAGFTPETNPDEFYDVASQPSIDWQGLLLQKGFVQESSARVSGGSNTTSYYLSGAFRGEEGYLRTTGIERYSFRTNIEQKVGNKVSVGLSLNPTRVIDERSGNQWAGSAWASTGWFRPNVVALDGNGDCRRDPILSFPGNPCIALEDQSIRGVTTHVLANTYLKWKPLPHLQFRTELGVESYQVISSSRLGEATWFGAPDGSASIETQQVFNYNWTNLVTWSHFWEKRQMLALTAGVQLTKDIYQQFGASTAGFTDDRIRPLGAGAILEEINSLRSQAAFAGHLFRVNYSFDDKYLLTGSARYDGSSRFGSANRYGFFPALSAGWVISEEELFKWKELNFLKLRSSVGLTGNASIGNNARRGLVNFDVGYAGAPGYIIQTIENENLGWEKHFQWDIGLEIGFWDNRILGSLGYYIKDTRDLLLNQPVPATNGINIIARNIGAIRNQGFEFNLTAEILKGNFNWTLQLNGATLKNKVQRLVDQDGDGIEEDLILNTHMLFRPGVSIGSFYLVEYAGVDPDNGDALFYDLEGKIVREAPSTNRRIAGKSLPSFTGGFSHTFRYKNLDLSTFFHFKIGYSIYWESSLEENMSDDANQRRSQLNAWRPDNRITLIPQARLFSQNGTQPSTRYLKAGDYLRLQHVNLGYTFVGLGSGDNQLRIFAAAQNLLTLTKFPGLDPDSEFYAPESAALGAIRFNLPAARTFTFGCNLTFN